jgi:hypothetical protein
MSKSKSRQTYYGDDHIFTTRGVSENNEICLKSTTGLTLCVDGRVTLANGLDQQVMYNDEGTMTGSDSFAFDKEFQQVVLEEGSAVHPSLTWKRDKDTGLYTDGEGRTNFTASGNFAGRFGVGGIQLKGDGPVGIPGLSFANEFALGLRRKALNVMEFVSDSVSIFLVAKTYLQANVTLFMAGTNTPALPAISFGTGLGIFGNILTKIIGFSVDGDDILTCYKNDNILNESVVRIKSNNTKYNLELRSDSGTSHTFIAMYNTGDVDPAAAIFWNGSFMTYTASDYRKKTNIVSLDQEDSFNKIMALKPCNYNWISTGVKADGFIAHEVGEVFPDNDIVTGLKDAVYDDGNIKGQSLDVTKLIPYLTSCMQFQTEMIKSLEERITFLENGA